MVRKPGEPKGKAVERPLSEGHDKHGISSLSDLPGKKIRTKLWPMSPIESLTSEEVLAIAQRDNTPVLMGVVLDGSNTGEQFICTNKKGASLPPEVAAEGSWAQKYYQQVVVLNETVRDMQEHLQPVLDLAKGQQALSVCVEVFDGLLSVANHGFSRCYQTWALQDKKAILTPYCDIRSPGGVNYISVLKNFASGKFDSLDPFIFQSVEDLLRSGEDFLIKHAGRNGFQCPRDIRDQILQFLPLKRDRNGYSHPLTLVDQPLAAVVLQRLKTAINNDEFDFMTSTKNLILLGADYAENVLHSYGRVKEHYFLDPKGKSAHPNQNSAHPSGDTSDDSPPHSPLYPHPDNFPLFGGPSSPRSTSPSPQSQSPSAPKFGGSPPGSGGSSPGGGGSPPGFGGQRSHAMNPNAPEFTPGQTYSPPSLQSSHSSPGSNSPPSQPPPNSSQGPPSQFPQRLQGPSTPHPQQGRHSPQAQYPQQQPGAPIQHLQQSYPPRGPKRQSQAQQSNPPSPPGGGAGGSRRPSTQAQPRQPPTKKLKK